MGLAGRLRELFERSALAVHLTPAQAELLMRIESGPRISELAEQKLCDPSSVTTMIGRLERDGLVRRVVDPDDARARRVRLTAKGTRVREQFLALVGDGATVIDELPDEHRAALIALLAPKQVPAPG
jgi:DNA-binding MarR family transcriptional regulator